MCESIKQLVPKVRFTMVGYRPPSTNDCYEPTSRRGGKGGAYLRKSNWLREWQSRAEEFFLNLDDNDKSKLNDFVNQVKTNQLGVEATISVSMPKETYGVNTLNKIDASNFIKPIEDSISKGIGLDDKWNIVVHSKKSYNNENKWILQVDLESTPTCWVEDDLNYKEERVYEFSK